ncbi:MAG: hypothetical protein ACRDNE_18820, partial [Gaiellaceae bacterium]
MRHEPAGRVAAPEIGFVQVYDYVAGKADRGSGGPSLEGAEGSETRAGARPHGRSDLPPAGSP